MSRPVTSKRIRIAAALIEDGAGRLLLVRKAGTAAFMQAGGKIETGETALGALRRELAEELNWIPEPLLAAYLGRYVAAAAHEPGWLVEAELFHVRASHMPAPGSEIAEVVWVSLDQARGLSLAPLTENHVLPLFERLPRAGPIGTAVRGRG